MFLTAEVATFVGGFAGAMLGGAASYVLGNYATRTARYRDPLWQVPGMLAGSVIGSSVATTIAFH